MNYALRNIVLIALIIFLIGFGYYYLFARQPGQYIPDAWNHLDCIYPVSIASDALEPTLKRGAMLSLNRCIENRETLDIGYVVTFNIEGIVRIGIIKDKNITNGELTYVITTHNDGSAEYSISPQDVTGYTDIQ